MIYLFNTKKRKKKKKKKLSGEGNLLPVCKIMIITKNEFYLVCVWSLITMIKCCVMGSAEDKWNMVYRYDGSDLLRYLLPSNTF